MITAAIFRQTDRQTDEIILSLFHFNNVNPKAHFMRIDAA